MLRGRPVGRGQQRPASLHSSLCRVESSPPDQGNWAPGVGALAGLDRWTVLPAAFCHGSKSSCYVLAGQGGADHPCSEGGGCQEDSGHADGGGDEEGQESPVDGVLGRPRLGKERRVPQDACVISQLYFRDQIGVMILIFGFSNIFH